MRLEDIFTLLHRVLPNKVFYGTNIYSDKERVTMPYLVYQEVNKRAIGYHDDLPIVYQSTIQITLVSQKKNPDLEKLLEKTLLEYELNYSLLSEFFNADQSVNRIYEIKIKED